MAGKKPAPAKYEEYSDDDVDESWEDTAVDSDTAEAEQALRLRDWRDVEKYREMKQLRELVDDEDSLEEIFEIPVKSRVIATVQESIAARAPKPAKAAPRPAQPKAKAKAAAGKKSPGKIKPKRR